MMTDHGGRARAASRRVPAPGAFGSQQHCLVPMSIPVFHVFCKTAIEFGKSGCGPRICPDHRPAVLALLDRAASAVSV